MAWYSRATELLFGEWKSVLFKGRIEEGANIDEIIKTCKSFLILQFETGLNAYKWVFLKQKELI
jgi:hypothetical protein